jgi:hypothetical protein
MKSLLDKEGNNLIKMIIDFEQNYFRRTKVLYKILDIEKLKKYRDSGIEELKE